MFFIRYYIHSKVSVLIGDLESIATVAHMLEDKKKYFKIGTIGGEPQKQSDFGLGNFAYWLNPDQSFWKGQVEKL
jgi:hypothetical protein